MPDEPTRRVTITAPGWSVDVTADGVELHQVADTARALFEDLRDPTQERLGPAGAGFQLPAAPTPFPPEWGQRSAARQPVRGGGE